MRLALVGAAGRMGRRIDALAAEIPRFRVVQRLTSGPNDAASAPRDEPGELDVVVDFSSEEGALRAAALAERAGAALLVGTTGLSDRALARLREASERAAVMIAPNTSRGVAVAARLAAEAARLLGPDYDVAILEAHHTKKRDAPSGTAKRLARAIEQGRGRAVPPEAIHAVRAGEIVGEHEIRFAGPGEELLLVHRAASRDLFARGALELAAWLKGREAGQYRPEDAWGM